MFLNYASLGQVDLMEECLESGDVDVNGSDFDERTALYVAASGQPGVDGEVRHERTHTRTHNWQR